MPIRLTIDRFEGNARQQAVLLTNEGVQINFPRALLPGGSKPGDVLTLILARDTKATGKLADRTRKIQGELKKTDPGGDLKL